MNPDDFEKKLQQQQMRSVPSEWRAEILHAANAVTSSRLSTVDPQPKSWLHQLFWPCPQAWAGVGGIWLVILALNASSADHTQVTAEAAPSAQLIMALLELRREPGDSAESSSVQPAEPPKPIIPRPRSERRITTAMV